MAVASKHQKHWIKLLGRICGLMLRQQQTTADLVKQSYDSHAQTYDHAWTHHMRDLSLKMLDALAPSGEKAFDYTCGTGFVTASLAERLNAHATGVDASSGMLAVAREQHNQTCDFICSDMLEHLRSLESNSVDVVTCAWGLGYSKPMKVIHQIARVLKPCGRVGIIDNTLFSLAGVMRASLETFAENPAALRHAMKVRFLPNSLTLAALMRLSGLRVLSRFDGSRTYYVDSGQAAIERLQQTGAAAGFELAAAPQQSDEIFNRFAEILDSHRTPKGIAITHRYLCAVGVKK